MSLPSPEEISPHLSDIDCFDVAAGVASQWPELITNSGYFIGDDGSAYDHHWNRAEDGTIVDATAIQFGVYDYLIRPNHPLYDRYTSYENEPQRTQSIAHKTGHHLPESDYIDCCPDCAAGLNADLSVQ